jgi:hypothetical protein
MDRAFREADADDRKSLIVEAQRDVLALAATSEESPPASTRPRIVRIQEPVALVAGDDLYEVRFYATEDQWRETVAAPPDILERIGRVGWIGATFVRSLGGAPPGGPDTDRRVRDRRAKPLGRPPVRPAERRQSQRRDAGGRRSDR